MIALAGQGLLPVPGGRRLDQLGPGTGRLLR